jgi:hypothetical protein
MKTDTTTVVISSLSQANAVLMRLKRLDYSEPWSVTWKLYKPNRSQEQINLMWKHYDNMYLEGKGAGAPHAIHEDHKRRYLIPYLKSLDVKKGPIFEWNQQLEFARDLYRKGYRKESVRLKEFLYSLVSTKWLNITQMSRYLGIIETETGPLPEKLDPEPDRQPPTTRK